jgi:hydrogenase-4 membrane subunit HyfE
MKILQVVLLTVAVTGIAFAGDVPFVPEIGLDGSTVVSAIGLLTGGLLLLRARRK